MDVEHNARRRSAAAMVAAAGEALPARRSPAGAGCAETGGPGVLGTSNLNVTIPGFVSPTTTTLRTYATEPDLMPSS